MTGGSWSLRTTLTIAGENARLNAPSSVPYSITPGTTQTLAYGTGAATGSVIVAETYGLAPGETKTINLYDGSELDIYGDPARFRVLRGYAVYVASGGSAAGVTVGNAGSNPHPLFFGAAANTKTVYPNGPADGGGSDAGTAVTSTSCNVKLVNNGTAVAVVAVHFAGSAGAAGVPVGLLLGLTYP